MLRLHATRSTNNANEINDTTTMAAVQMNAPLYTIPFAWLHDEEQKERKVCLHFKVFDGFRFRWSSSANFTSNGTAASSTNQLLALSEYFSISSVANGAQLHSETLVWTAQRLQAGHALQVCVALDDDSQAAPSFLAADESLHLRLSRSSVFPTPASGFNISNSNSEATQDDDETNEEWGGIVRIRFAASYQQSQPVEQAQEISLAVAGASSLAGTSPTVAAAASRQQLMKTMAVCPRPMVDEPLGADASPLGLSVGDGLLRYHIGAMYGNLLLFAAIAVGFAVLALGAGWASDPRKFLRTHLSTAGDVNVESAYVVDTEEEQQLTPHQQGAWHRGCAYVRFPGRLAPVGLFLYQSTLGSTLRVLLYSSADDEGNSGGQHHQYLAAAIAALMAVAIFVLPVAIGLPRRLRKSALFVPIVDDDDDIDNNHHSRLRRDKKEKAGCDERIDGIWASIVHNIPSHDDMRWDDGSASSPLLLLLPRHNFYINAVERFGTAFEDYDPRCLNILLFDILIATLGGCIVAFNPTTRNDCLFLSLFAVSVFFFAALTAVAIRPFVTIMNNCFYAVISVAQLCSAIAINAALEQQRNSDTWMARYELSQAVLSLVITLWCVVQLSEAIHDAFTRQQREPHQRPHGFAHLHRLAEAAAAQRFNAAAGCRCSEEVASDEEVWPQFGSSYGLDPAVAVQE